MISKKMMVLDDFDDFRASNWSDLRSGLLKSNGLLDDSDWYGLTRIAETNNDMIKHMNMSSLPRPTPAVKVPNGHDGLLKHIDELEKQVNKLTRENEALKMENQLLKDEIENKNQKIVIK